MHPVSMKFLFVVFLSILLSKILWYDLRLLWPVSDHRDITTWLYAIWVLLQIAFYLSISSSVFRQRIPNAVLIWITLVIPYFLIGVIENRTGVFFAGDVARYSLPIGFIIYLTFFVGKIPVKFINRTIIIIIASFTIGRTLIHLSINWGGFIRYGVEWEVFLPILLAAFVFLMRGWRLVAVLLGICILSGALVIGQTRSLLAGIAIGVVAVSLLSLFRSTATAGAKARTIISAAAALVIVAAPMVIPSRMFDRISIYRILDDTEARSSNARQRDRPSVEAPAEMQYPSGSVESRERRELVGNPPSSPALQAAKLRWEAAIKNGDHTLDVRFAEARYFLTRMSEDTASFLLGSGAGGAIEVELPSASERIVRGAHNTFVTLLYRHGVVLGTLLILFVSFYGLWTNFRQLMGAADPEWRILLIALISYRISAFFMAQLHQGLFDDPLVFLSMAIAIANPDMSESTEENVKRNCAPCLNPNRIM